METASTRALKRVECLTGLASQTATSVPAAECWSWSPRELSMMRRGWADRPGSARMALASWMPSISGICMSRRTIWNGLPAESAWRIWSRASAGVGLEAVSHFQPRR
jgi:hypothetical protein